jgi:hypothetical protein
VGSAAETVVTTQSRDSGHVDYGGVAVTARFEAKRLVRPAELI